MPLCEICHKNQAVIYATRLEHGQPIYEGLCLKCVFKHGYIKFGGLEEMMNRFGVTEDNVDEVTEQLNKIIGSVGEQDPQELLETLMQGGLNEEMENVIQRFMGQFQAPNASQFQDTSSTDQEEEENPIDDYIDDYLEQGDDEADDKSETDDVDHPNASDLLLLGFDDPEEIPMDDMDADDLKNLEALSELDFHDLDDEDLAEIVKALPDDFISGDSNFIERLKEYLLPDTEDSEMDSEAEVDDEADDTTETEAADDSEDAEAEDEDDQSDDDQAEEDQCEVKETDVKDQASDEQTSQRQDSDKESSPDFADLIPATNQTPQATPTPPKEDPRSRSRRTRHQRRGNRELRHLKQYGRNLNESYRRGEIDPLIGREEELQRVIQILNRRMKNNPVLLGEPGVGKTAIAEGLAGRIVQGKVPAKLLDMELYLLDLTAMVAGTQFRGQFESRMKAVVDDAKKAGNVILVIDEIHNIMGAGDAEGAMNAANILKPALAQGDICVLGSTTLDEYRRFIEKDHALERRFQQVIVEESTREEAIEILKGNREYYEAHHFVRYPDDVITACVDLSIRYINDRFLPDKAIDIMDEAGSLANLRNEKLVDITKLRNKVEKEKKVLDRLQERTPKEGQEERFYELQAQTRADYLKAQEEYQEVADELEPTVITFEDVASVVETWTGIPVSRVTLSESERLLNLEDTIHERLVGQDEAVNALARAIRRNRAGIRQSKKPASFIFVGPTGVGKTEMVKALAVAMFDQEDAYIRLDMSEYMEAHTVSKLIGSPPGYVGYDDGGQLTEKVRRRPYSIILLDEIEKAHADVYNMLLQILDDGRLTDSHGRVVDFSHTIIVMTSNAGTTSKAQGMGFGQDRKVDMENHVRSVLKEIFRPEFLNRIDEIIIFDHLSREELRQIVDLMLQDVQKGLAEYGIRLSVDDDVKDQLAKEGYDPAYGARPLRRTITRRLEDPLTDYFLRGELKDVGVVNVSMDEDPEEVEKPEFKFSFEASQAKAQ